MSGGMDNLRKQADMSNRTWRTHPTFDSYEVSDDGRVRSLPRYVNNRWGGSHRAPSRELATFVRKGGYLGGNISVNGTRINFEVHRFVCETFHGLPGDADQQVRHLNGDKLDNRADNLCWGTVSENALDKVRHGTHHEAAKTRCVAGHPFSDDNTYRAPGAPNKRRCRTCDKARDARRVRQGVIASGGRT